MSVACFCPRAPHAWRGVAGAVAGAGRALVLCTYGDAHDRRRGCGPPARGRRGGQRMGSRTGDAARLCAGARVDHRTCRGVGLACARSPPDGPPRSCRTGHRTEHVPRRRPSAVAFSSLPKSSGSPASGRPWRLRAAVHVDAHDTARRAVLTGAPDAVLPRRRSAIGGLSPLVDQQLGGAIMLLVGGLSYLAGGLWLTARLLRLPDGAASPAEAGVNRWRRRSSRCWRFVMTAGVAARHDPHPIADRAADAFRRQASLADSRDACCSPSPRCSASPAIVPIKASSGHWRITAAFLDFAKVRSVSTHSLFVRPPPLLDTPLWCSGRGPLPDRLLSMPRRPGRRHPARDGGHDACAAGALDEDRPMEAGGTVLDREAWHQVDRHAGVAGAAAG